ncbi:MAG TPA: glycosyltransferase family 39 protein [Candidatus Limnocylindrales bacterium]
MSPRLARLVATPAIPVVVAIVLGLWRAGDKSVWLDEGVSVAIARLPTLDMLVHLWRVELHAAPYYLALHPWLALGDSESAIRALSVVFGVVAVLATWAIGRRHSAATGFYAALLLSVTPVFIQHEQEARGYSLLMAASAIATLLWLRLVERPGRWRALAYIVVAAALIYVHPLGALVVVAHALAALLLVEPALRRRLLVVFVPIVIGWLPMLRFTLLNRDRISWIPPTTVEIATTELLALAGGALVAIVLLAALLLGLRRDVITLWLVVPIVGTLAASLLIQPMFEMRYLLSATPAAAIVAARSRPALVGLLVAVSLVGVWGWYEAGAAKDDWRAAAGWVVGQAEPGDGIVFAPDDLRTAFGYHARVGDPLWPPLPWSVSDLRHGPVAEAVAGITSRRRVWLVEAHAVALPAEVSAALAPLRPSASRTFAGPHGLRVSLLVRDEPSLP